jgi:hypothetical protein
VYGRACQRVADTESRLDERTPRPQTVANGIERCDRGPALRRGTPAREGMDCCRQSRRCF